MEFKVDKDKFSQTKSKQQMALEKMQAYHNEQQALFNELASTWKGAGGDAFRDCSAKISNGALMSIFMISSLNAKAQDAQRYFETTDRDIANSVSSTGFPTRERIALGLAAGSLNTGNALAYGGVSARVQDVMQNTSLKLDSNSLKEMLWGGAVPNLGVRATFEARIDVKEVKWERPVAGESTVTITFKDGRNPQVLKEGVDYYMEGDKAYLYNNVRTILESHGLQVDYQQMPSLDGRSVIAVSKKVPFHTTPFTTEYTPWLLLVEGRDYVIGADGKAHFIDGAYGTLPPGAVMPVPAPAPTPAPAPAPISPGIVVPIPTTTGESSDITEMLNRLLNDKTLGLSDIKKNTIIGIGRTMLNEGYPPAFVTGMLANIIHEGSAGLFESSAYKSNKPKYLQYMDDNYDYRQKYSGKNVMDISISDLCDLMQKLEKDNWQKGKFGLGCVQWTGGRTKSLVDVYKEVASTSDTLTFEQMLYAEGLMISREFAGAYHAVYTDWLKNNENNLNSVEAAYSAGSIICMKYEVPADYANKSVTRGNTAKDVYKVMMGL